MSENEVTHSRVWRTLSASNVRDLPVNTGVYALREAPDGATSVFMAGGRSRLGIRGELTDALARLGARPTEFTYVSTNNYFTLYRERCDFPERFDATNPFFRCDGVTVAQRGPS